jgi:hypothetical protein
MRRLVLVLAVSLALYGCGESGMHFAERQVPVPSAKTVEGNIAAFEEAVRERRPREVCRYLTPRSLRELLIGPQGQIPRKPVFKYCPRYIAIREKSGTRNVPPIHVTSVQKEEFKDRFVLVVYVDRGPGLIMDNSGRRIESFAGPE